MRSLALAILSILVISTGYALAEKGTNVDSVTFVEHGDQNTAIRAMQNGSFDLYYYQIPPNLVSGGAPEGIRTYDSANGVVYTLLTNPAPGEDTFNPFEIREVRYALNFLVDRDYIVDDLMQGKGSTTVSAIDPLHSDYQLVREQVGSVGIRHDPQRAEGLIADALASKGAIKEDGAWKMDGDLITVKIFIRSDDQIRKSLGERLAADLRSMGFAVETTNGNLRDAYNAVFGTDPEDLGWHIYTGAYTGGKVTKYDSGTLAAFYAPWGLNMPGRGNPDYWNYENKLLDSITMRISDERYESAEARANLVRQATLEGVQESVRIFLATRDSINIVRDSVSGVVSAQGYGISHRATPINIDSDDKDLAIGVKFIEQSSWNPVFGFADSYSTNIYTILHDPSAIRDPFTGDLTPVRATWQVTTAGPAGTMQIPDDAVLWDPSVQRWDAVEPDAVATSKIVFDFRFGKWHNGISMDMNDVLYPLYFGTDWSTRDSSNPDDIRKYLEELARTSLDTEKDIKGIRVVDSDTIEVYTGYWHFDDAEIAADASIWSSFPWEVYAAMESLVLDGKASFTNLGADSSIPWLSLLERDDSNLLRTALAEFQSENAVPSGLYSAPTDATARYMASASWITAKGNAMISNGPFYLDSYNPSSRTLVAKAFDDPDYPLSPGHWNYLAADHPNLSGTVTIGSVAPVTGGAMPYGVEVTAASTLALEHFNEFLEERNAGWQLNIERRDSKTTPDGAVEALADLNGAGIKIIDGVALDYPARVAEYANANDMLLVSCCSVTTPLIQNGDALFRMAPGHAHHGERLAKLMGNDGITTVIPAGIDNVWATDLLDQAGRSFAGLGTGNAVLPQVVYSTDQSQAVAALAAAVAEQSRTVDASKIAVLYIDFEQNVEFIKQAAQHDILDDIRWYGADLSTKLPNLIDDTEARMFAERVQLTSVQPAVTDNALTTQIREYIARNTSLDRQPSVYASYEYDGVWLLGLSILSAQSTDVAKVKEALANVSGQYVGATGNTMLDAAGDRTRGQYSVWKVEDGKWVNVVGIGGLIPITRADGAGVHRNVATEFAVDDFNRYLAGNDATWRLEVDVRDTIAGNSLDAVRSFNSEGTKYFTGPSSSGRVSQLKDYVDANNMILLSCCSTAPSLAIEGDNVFRLAADDSVHGRITAEVLRDDGMASLIMVWRNDTFGKGLSESTGDRFAELGGTVVEIGGYDICTEDGCYDAAFERITAQLRDAVQNSVDMYGRDKVVVSYVGVGEAAEFIEAASAHPVLRTVKWIGSDANVLSRTLVENQQVSEFLSDVGFTAHIFDANTTGEKYQDVKRRLAADPRILGTPNVYTYASYDAVWVLGLAMDAARGEGFDAVKRQIPLVAEKYDGALGRIHLNTTGDAAVASHAIWGIRDGTWVLAGTYVPGTGLIVPPATISVLAGDGAPTDSGLARAMQIAADDHNKANPKAPVRLDTVNASGMPIHAAMQNASYVIDDTRRDSLRSEIDSEIASYNSAISGDTTGGAASYFDSVSAGESGVFVLDRNGMFVAHSDPAVRGTSIESLKSTYDKGIAGILADAARSTDGETWWQYMQGQTPGSSSLERSLLVMHEDYIFGKGYAPAKKNDVYFVVHANDADVASLKAYADVYAKDAVMVSPSSSSASLAGNDHLFRLIPSDINQIQALSQRLASDSKSQVILVSGAPGAAPIQSSSDEAKRLVADALDAYARNGPTSFEAITSMNKTSTYPFVITADTAIYRADGSVLDRSGSAAWTPAELDAATSGVKGVLDSGRGAWITYVGTNPETGQDQAKRTWLTQRDGLIFGAEYHLDGIAAKKTAVDWETTKAISLYKLDGKDAAFAAINALRSTAEIYPFVLDRDGIVESHGSNTSIIGRFSGDLVNYSMPWPEIIAELDQTGTVAVRYEYTNPESGLVEPKHTFMRLHDGYVFGSGYYLSEWAESAINSAGNALVLYDAYGAGAFEMITALNAKSTYPFVLTADTAINRADGSVLDRRGVTAWTPAELDAATSGVKSVLDSGRGAWISYVVTNPETDQNQAKRSWVVQRDGLIFGAGYYLDGVDGKRIEAQWEVAKAISLYKLDGKDAAFAAINAMMSTEEIYPFVLDRNGIVASHGVRASLVGSFVGDIVMLEKPWPEIVADLDRDGTTTTNYDYINPETGMVEPKHATLRLFDGYVFGSGYYGDPSSADAASPPESGTIHSVVQYDSTSLSYSDVAIKLESRLADVLADQDRTNTAIVFTGTDAEFVGIAGAISRISSAASSGVSWYGMNQVANSSIILSDPNASRLAEATGLAATIFDATANPVNMALAAGIGMDKVGPYTYGAYDSVRLLAASMAEAKTRQSTVQSVLPGVADATYGALGDYELDSAGDLAKPTSYSTYMVTRAEGAEPAWTKLDGRTYANAAVVGTVFSDTNRNGILDAGETGISGYGMYATDAKTGKITSTTTASDGSYSFEFPSGNSRVLIQAHYYPPGHTLTSDFTVFVRPDAGAATTFNVGFRPALPHESISLDITAYMDSNSNGTRDDGESVVPGIRLSVYSYKEGLTTYLVTDASGSASVTGLVPSDHMVQLQAPGYDATESEIRYADGRVVKGAALIASPAPGSEIELIFGLVATS